MRRRTQVKRPMLNNTVFRSIVEELYQQGIPRCLVVERGRAKPSWYTKNTMMLEKILEFGSNFDHRFVPDYDELSSISQQLREMGKKIVLTQGVYDLVHEGHARYLETAHSHGDILIVGVDTDAFTKKRKGPNRPIVPQDERLRMLVQLRYVDIVTLRDDDDGRHDLIQCVKPDVLITSETTADFEQKTKQWLLQFCGAIVTLPAQATISTTARIRNLEIGGADRLADELHKRIPSVVAEALEVFRSGSGR